MDEPSAWNTSEAVGGSLTGTMLGQQAAETWGKGPSPAAGTGGFGDSLKMALGNLGQFQAAGLAQQEQAQPGVLNVKQDVRKGTTTLEVTNGALAEVFGQLTDLKTMQTAAMARVAQLRQQEASGSPILDALSQFAGNMAANDPTMPGWVRALGATNLAMGPHGIKRERMMEEQKALAYGKEIGDLGMSVARFSELEEARAERAAAAGRDQQRIDIAKKAQEITEANTNRDNFRADVAPVLTSAKATGILTPEHEAAIRSLRERYPNMSDSDIEREVGLARGMAKAAMAEKDRVAKARAAEATARASATLARVAAANGIKVNTLVQTEQVKAGAKEAARAKVDDKEAARVEGLHLLAGDIADLEKDDWWQGVVSGKIAQTAPLTTEQQMLVATRARAFVAKMSTMGLSFAKTSEKEMEKILATVPQPGQTKDAMKQLSALMDRDARRAAAEIAARNWGETTDSIAQMFPSRYVDSAIEAHQRKLGTLSRGQRMGLGIVNGDDDLIAEGLAGVRGSVGAPQNSTRPGEIRMANPTAGKTRVSYEDFK